MESKSLSEKFSEMDSKPQVILVNSFLEIYKYFTVTFKLGSKYFCLPTWWHSHLLWLLCGRRGGLKELVVLGFHHLLLQEQVCPEWWECEMSSWP